MALLSRLLSILPIFSLSKKPDPIVSGRFKSSVMFFSEAIKRKFSTISVAKVGKCPRLTWRGGSASWF